MTVASRELWTRVSGLRSWDRTTGRGHRDRTAGIEQLGQDNQYKTAMSGQPGRGKPGQENWDRITGTGKSEKQIGLYSQDQIPDSLDR